MKTLVVAEKPSVGSDIARFLGCTERKKGYIEGEKYIVTWCVGHLIGLKFPHEHDESYKAWKMEHLPFAFGINESLKVLDATKDQFKVVKELINRNDVDMLINAGDAGREGYLIQEWVYRMSGNKKPKKVLWASSFTDEALKKAFANLKDPKDFTSLLEEAEGRAEGDYLLGINYSRALTLTVGNNQLLRYGRCQTPLLNLIVKRDREIESFVSEPYNIIQVEYQEGFTGMLVGKDGKPLSSPYKEYCENVIDVSIKGYPLVVDSYKEEEKSRKAPELFNLAALQKTMGSRYGYTPEETLEAAQSLYEKHKMISYPRTDSRHLSTDLYHEIAEHLKACDFGKFSVHVKKIDLANIQPDKRYFNDHKVTDHYALIPTELKTMEKEYGELTEIEKNVFDAIATSLIAIFFPEYRYTTTELVTVCNRLHFLSKGISVVDLGYKEVFSMDEEEERQDSEIIPKKSIGDVLEVSDIKILEKMTKPPKRYTDSSIISVMEKYDIGTSATRAEILKKLQDPKSEYVKREKGKYISTQIGREYIDIIPDELKEPELTQKFEAKLKQINEGVTTKTAFLAELLADEKANIEKFKASEKKISTAVPESDMKCPICGDSVDEKSKGFFCRNKECTFALWNEMKFYANTIKINKTKARQLLTESKRAAFKLTNKDGKEYEAYLKIKINGKYTNFEMDGFVNKKKGK